VWFDHILYVWTKGFTLLLCSQHMGIYHAGESVCVGGRGEGGEEEEGVEDRGDMVKRTTKQF